MQKNSVVIYESTVYPGATEEVCVPLLEQESGLIFNIDFFVGYSPERINPGDKTHRIDSIVKVTSGSTEDGDLNIALINELAMIFNKLRIDTEEVLEAAGTKWNFMPFRPGLVGGHCISVDPYYLTHKAQQIGHHPQIILSGRRINDFKENCPDLRNTRVIDIIHTLKSYHASVDVYDPWANLEEAKQEYGLTLISQPEEHQYDAVVIAVSHKEFVEMGGEAIRKLGKSKHVLYDIKSLLSKTEVENQQADTGINRLA